MGKGELGKNYAQLSRPSNSQKQKRKRTKQQKIAIALNVNKLNSNLQDLDWMNGLQTMSQLSID